MLHGWAFVSVYALLGLPIARLADRGSRRLIIGVGMAFWSVSTALCGFANSFAQFFAARAGVGAGESAYAPAVYSILQDSFPPEKLPRVFAIMAIGFAYGTSFGVILGAGLLVLAGTLAVTWGPLFGGIAPWQMVLMLVAIPGVLLAFVMATVQEPRRRGLLPGAARTVLPVRQVFDYFMANGRTYAPMFAAMGIKAMLEFRRGVWLPEMFRRSFEWAPSENGAAHRRSRSHRRAVRTADRQLARRTLREARFRRRQSARAADRDHRRDSDFLPFPLAPSPNGRSRSGRRTISLR